LAEAVAALGLRLRGYRIVARRFKTPVGEVDLIALRGRVLAFVEVKRRPSQEAAAWAVTPAQRFRIERAAQLFLARDPRWAAYQVRFDVILLGISWWPTHILDAWRPGSRVG
jgi:putative endonuclease